MAPTSIAYPAPKAFTAILYDAPVILTQDSDHRIVVLTPNHEFFAYFTVEMAPWTTVLGEISLFETQRLADKRHGGAARIACSRPMEVQ